MINQPIKFDVPNSTCYGNMKGVVTCKKWSGLGWLGVTNVIENSAIQYSAYDAYEFLLAFRRKYARFLRHSEILVEIADVNLPHLYLAPLLRVTSLEFRQDFWSPYGIVCDPRFSHLCTTLTCDGQTDRHMMTANTVLA